MHAINEVQWSSRTKASSTGIAAIAIGLYAGYIVQTMRTLIAGGSGFLSLDAIRGVKGRARKKDMSYCAHGKHNIDDANVGKARTVPRVCSPVLRVHQQETKWACR